ncbi:MAG: hypothetical protein ACYDCK_00040 [Thermoplasmatota archaeon]
MNAKRRSSHVMRALLAGVLLFGAALAVGATAPTPKPQTHAWTVTSNDNGPEFWFTIKGDAQCVGAKNPTCTLAPGDSVDVKFANNGTQPSDFTVAIGNATTNVVSCCAPPGGSGSGHFSVPATYTGKGSYSSDIQQLLGVEGKLVIEKNTSNANASKNATGNRTGNTSTNSSHTNASANASVNSTHGNASANVSAGMQNKTGNASLNRSNDSRAKGAKRSPLPAPSVAFGLGAVSAAALLDRRRRAR